MSQQRRMIAFSLSVVAALLLTVSDTRGPTVIYEKVLQALPMFVSDPLLLSMATIAVMVLVGLSLLGGITVFFGGYLIYRDHVTSGKLLIGLGAGVGIPWLIIILLNVVLTRDLTSVITRYSITGWTGIILAFMARTIAK